jgi:hypothetical protein
MAGASAFQVEVMQEKHDSAATSPYPERVKNFLG